MPHNSPPRAWAQVDLGAVRHNLSILREAAGGAGMMPVIKAGAYGHGLEGIARLLDNEGISFFGVANVGEARRLAQAGCRTKPYILGPCFAEEREEVVCKDWCAFMSTFEEGDHYNSLAALYGKKLPIHISVDVGMGRGGFLTSQLTELLDRLPQWPHLVLEGVASHLPGADEDRPSTLRQIERFSAAADTVEQRNPCKYRHVAASAGILDYDIPAANLARPGLALYGYSPVDTPLGGDLRCALTLESRITVVRTLPAGHGVSYGSIFTTSAPTKVATVGFGYADGYPRALSGKGAHVYYKGRRVPLLGRVTMDQIMIDASGIDDAAPGDTVEIFGPHIPASELAQLAGTITWEILTSIGPRIPRLFA